MSAKQFTLLVALLLGFNVLQFSLLHILTPTLPQTFTANDDLSKTIADLKSLVSRLESVNPTSLDTEAKVQLLEDFAAVVRSEVGQLNNIGIKSDFQGGRQASGVKSTDPGNEEVFSQASNILDKAISAGVWTREEFYAVTALAQKLSLKQRDTLAQKMSDALNKGQLNLTEIVESGVPFSF